MVFKITKINFKLIVTFLLLVLVIVLVSISCGGKGDTLPPTPPPVKPDVIHIIKYNSNTQNADAFVYDNGTILSSASTGADGKAEGLFTNKESITTVDSVVVKKTGYTTFKQVNQAIGTLKTYNFSLDPLNTTTHGDLSFKMVDQITRDTILNYAIIKGIDTIPIAKEYVEENILLGDQSNFSIIQTDSVSRNFSQFDKTYEITNAQNNFLEEITSTPREFETQQTIIVQGNQGHRVDNLTLTILGQDYEVPPSGIIARNFALDEDTNNPGHALNETINLILKQTDSSHALVNEVAKELILKNGVQQDTIIGNTLPINRWANYIGAYANEANNVLSDVNVTSTTKSGVTDVNGNIRLDNILELVEDPTHWWKSLDGQETINATKNGFLPYSRTLTLQVGDNNFNETMISESAPVANSTINLKNQNTQNLIQNIIVQYNGTDLAVDQDFTLNNVSPGDHTLTFKQSDSTYQMFTNFSHTFTIPEGNTNYTLDVDAIIKTFQAQYNLDVDDSNNNTLENINAAIDGVNYSLPENGIIPTITIPLNPDTLQPWNPQNKNISIAINPTNTSYQFTTQAHTFTLNEGTNNDNTIITTQEFNWLANLVGNAKDENATNLAGATLSANAQSDITDAQGQARIDGVIQLPAGANFWEPGTTQLTYTMTKDGYSDQTPKTITVNEGDNIVNETLTQIINATYGSATVQLRDVNTSQIIENILVTNNENNITTAIDDTFNLNNVLTGTYNLTLKQSDSTYQLFSELSQNIDILEGNNSFIFDVDATTKTFTGTYTQSVVDDQNRPLTNIKNTIDGVEYILPANGISPIVTFSIPADAIKPWLAGSKDIVVSIDPTPTSYSFSPLSFTKTLNEGTNTDSKTISTTNQFNFVATYNLDVIDTQGETQENMKLTLDGETIILPANGQVSRTFPLTQQDPSFWLAQEKTLNALLEPTDSSFQFTPLTYSKIVGDGITNDSQTITTIPFQWFANLLVNVKDQNAIDLAGVTLSANAKTANTDTAGNAVINQVIELPAGSNFWESGTANVTYDLIKDGYQDFPAKTVALVQGDNSYSETLDEIIISNTTGDVGIEPLLAGLPKNNTTIKLINTIVRDSTYTISTNVSTAQAIFYNIYVSDANNPTQYEVFITDNLADGTFLETTAFIDIYQDVNGEINGSKIVNLNEIPNVQDITSVVYDYSSLAKASGVRVDLMRDSDNAIVDSQVSDVSGAVFFNDVPGSASYHLRNSKSGNYTKTNGSFSVPLVDLISEMVGEQLNVITVPQFNYSDGTSVAAADIQKYKPLEFNTEFY